jgi:hypothetical protein
LKIIGSLVGLAVLIGGILYGVDYYRHRFVRTDADLVKLLPPGDLTTFFSDIDQLRAAGMLHLLTGVKAASDADYAEFVKATQFDYTRDMQALAGAVDGGQIFFVVRGHFDWDKLAQYAGAHGGTCQGETCRVPASKPGRWANFFPVQADVIALAISDNQTAADMLRPPGRRVQDQPIAGPVWVRLSTMVLRNPESLPLAARIFAITLQSAESVVLSVGQAAGSSEAFTIRLNAEFQNAAAADTTKKQLDIQTRMLKLELAKEQQKPNPADLTGLFTAGSFQAVEKRVVGEWPVRKELLEALE